MSTLNPRVTTTASNVPGGTCGQYQAPSSDSYFTFTLPQAEYIETLHFTSEAVDFNIDFNTYGEWTPQSTCSGGASNMHWNEIDVYAGPSNLSISDITTNSYFCGKPAVNKTYVMNAAGDNLNLKKINKMIKMGERITCGTDKIEKIVLHFLA